MICKKCGTNNSSNLQNCLACGEPLMPDTTSELTSDNSPDLSFMGSDCDFNAAQSDNAQSSFGSIGADYHLNEIVENKNNNKGFRFYLSPKQKKYIIGCGIGLLVGFVFLLVAIVTANVLADKVLDKWENSKIRLPTNGYVDIYDRDEHTQAEEDVTYFDFPIVVFKEEAGDNPMIVLLNNDELHKITEVEAFRCGKIIVSSQFGTSCHLKTNEGKIIKFELTDKQLPDDIAGKYVFVKGIEDSEGNVLPEIIFITDRDIKMR